MSGPAQHTPRPWRVEGPDLHGQYEILGPDADGLGFGENVAAVAGGLGDDGANARLIAQAPALADALRRFVEFAELPDGDLSDVAPYTSRKLTALGRQARAVLAAIDAEVKP